MSFSPSIQVLQSGVTNNYSIKLGWTVIALLFRNFSTYLEFSYWLQLIDISKFHADSNFAASPGIGFTPHIIDVKVGEVIIHNFLQKYLQEYSFAFLYILN